MGRVSALTVSGLLPVNSRGNDLGMEATKKDKAMAEIASRFGFHKPDEDGVKRMTMIRKKVRELALVIERECPDVRELGHFNSNGVGLVDSF